MILFTNKAFVCFSVYMYEFLLKLYNNNSKKSEKDYKNKFPYCGFVGNEKTLYLKKDLL